jgi:REP element-mobilizing transposase RayT
VTYLITFACYGCHLHGDAAGSVDRAHHVPGTPILEMDVARVAFVEQRMDQPPYHLDHIRRDAVLEAIQGVCAHRGWNLLAAHVRSNHVHAVVEAEVPPVRILNDSKAYASRCLNRMVFGGTGPETMGAPWQHTMAVDAAACLGGHPVRCCRAG